jgi:hypothetical protein
MSVTILVAALAQEKNDFHPMAPAKALLISVCASS